MVEHSIALAAAPPTLHAQGADGASRPTCATCPYWIHGYRGQYPDFAWITERVTKYGGSTPEKREPIYFGDCRRRAARPLTLEEGEAFGRSHQDDFCGEHPDFPAFLASRAEPRDPAASDGGGGAEIEHRARQIAADKMGLVKDPTGARLPDDLWRQAIPLAEVAVVRRQNGDLLSANIRFEARARAAEARVAELERSHDPNGDWQTLDTCPSKGESLWIWGGPYLEPERRKADGEWWRRERGLGSMAMPTHWCHDRAPKPPAPIQGEHL